MAEREKYYLDKASKLPQQDAVRNVIGTKPNFAIALDATGSMASLIDAAKQNITEILNRIYQEASTQVKIRLYVYRDYDVSKEVLESSELTNNSQDLVHWLSRVRTFGGGANAGEAIEQALQAIYNAEEASAVLLAGDEPSNPASDLTARGFSQILSAHEWAKRFGAKTVPIHSFVVGHDPRTIQDFQEISRLSGGQSGRLDGNAEMIDMAVMAMLARLKGSRSVNEYMSRRSLTNNSKKFGTLLLSGPNRS